jgi:hypothetical protein
MIGGRRKIIEDVMTKSAALLRNYTGEKFRIEQGISRVKVSALTCVTMRHQTQIVVRHLHAAVLSHTQA